MISSSLRPFEESRTNASYVIRHYTVRHFARCIVPICVCVIVCVCACVRDILCYKLFPVGVKITTVAFGSIQHLSVSVSIRAAASSLSVSILFFTIIVVFFTTLFSNIVNRSREGRTSVPARYRSMYDTRH